MAVKVGLRNRSWKMPVLILLIGIAGCASELKLKEAKAAAVPISGSALVIGTYTGEPGEAGLAPSQGLYVLRLDSGRLQEPQLLAELENPSYVAVDKDTRRLYAVSEVRQGEVAAYQLESDGSARLINRVSAGGASPCYLAVSPSGGQLALANYATGNIAVYTLNSKTGALSEPVQLRQHRGRGVHPQRQKSPHAHWVGWDPAGDFLYAVDLGTDKVMGYPVNRDTGELDEAFVALEAEPGAGPRHMAFHPRAPLVYVLNELDNSLLLAERNHDGTFTPLQRVSTLPENFSEHSQAAHIAINAAGTRVYVSNRGHDSLAVFDVSEGGRLSIAQWAGTGGKWPRHFSLLPEHDFLAVANQHSHSIQLFKLDSNGRLKPAGPAARVAQPTFVGPVTFPF